MKFTDSLNRKNIVIAAVVLAAGFVVLGFFALQRPTRVEMERYAPADALAFIEVDSLADLVDGFTRTKAWRELAPVLGLSSQLKQVGPVADLIGRTGLGPDEAVVAGRAQLAIAITGLDSEVGQTDEGPYLHLKPRFAVIIETHMKPASATRLLELRAPTIAQRIYGESVTEDSEDYQGSKVLIFSGPAPRRQLVASAVGSAIAMGNDIESIKACLDSIAGRTTSLAKDPTIEQMKSEVGSEPAVFGYLSPKGIQKLLELSPGLISGRASDSDAASLIADLVEHLSKQAVSGLLYSMSFEAGGVSEKYLTVLKPQVAEALAAPLKPTPGASFESLGMIPREIESLSVLDVERAGDFPERVLKHVSPTLDVVAGVALREFVISFRRQYGLGPTDSIGDAIGTEIAWVNFGDDQPRAMLVRVQDKSRLLPAVTKYLVRKGSSVGRDQYNGTEILLSSEDNRRAASFGGNFLVLGTRDQIIRCIDTSMAHDGMDRDERFKHILETRPANASLISYRPRGESAGKLLLAISELTRVTDGSPDLLEGEKARKALDRLPRSIVTTEFRNYGAYTESHSAVGSLSFISEIEK